MLTGGYNNTATAEQQTWQFKPAPNALKKPAEQAAAKQVANKAEAAKTEWYSQLTMTDVTTVSIMPEEVEAPRLLNFGGYKIDLASKIADLKGNFIKNYSLTKSHNLMVARFAEFKTAALGALLSMLGVPREELENLQKKATRDAIRQNKALFEENEYNRELLDVIGASKKRLRAQNKLLNEVSTQLMIQAVNLGLEGEYSQERILEIRLEQCKKILDKFLEEKDNLEYQHQMVLVG